MDLTAYVANPTVTLSAPVKKIMWAALRPVVPNAPSVQIVPKTKPVLIRDAEIRVRGLAEPERGVRSSITIPFVAARPDSLEILLSDVYRKRVSSIPHLLNLDRTL